MHRRSPPSPGARRKSGTYATKAATKRTSIASRGSMTEGRRIATCCRSQIEVHYALSPDGSTRLLWERRLHPALILLALLLVTAAATFVALWIQALRAAFRGPPAPAPTPDNGPNP
jgi:hypothetical protein